MMFQCYRTRILPLISPFFSDPREETVSTPSADEFRLVFARGETDSVSSDSGFAAFREQTQRLSTSLKAKHSLVISGHVTKTRIHLRLRSSGSAPFGQLTDLDPGAAEFV